MKQYRDYYRDENLDERLIVAQCSSVTPMDIFYILDDALLKEFLADMRERTLNSGYLSVSEELAAKVLKSAVWEMAANYAAKIQFGDNDNLEALDENA